MRHPEVLRVRRAPVRDWADGQSSCGRGNDVRRGLRLPPELGGARPGDPGAARHLDRARPAERRPHRDGAGADRLLLAAAARPRSTTAAAAAWTGSSSGWPASSPPPRPRRCGWSPTRPAEGAALTARLLTAPTLAVELARRGVTVEVGVLAEAEFWSVYQPIVVAGRPVRRRPRGAAARRRRRPRGRRRRPVLRRRAGRLAAPAGPHRPRVGDRRRRALARGRRPVRQLQPDVDLPAAGLPGQHRAGRPRDRDRSPASSSSRSSSRTPSPTAATWSRSSTTTGRWAGGSPWTTSAPAGRACRCWPPSGPTWSSWTSALVQELPGRRRAHRAEGGHRPRPPARRRRRGRGRRDRAAGRRGHRARRRPRSGLAVRPARPAASRRSRSPRAAGSRSRRRGATGQWQRCPAR